MDRLSTYSIGQCCYCETSITVKSNHTREHLVPLSKGGNSSVHNIRPCCRQCNSERGNKDYYFWIAELLEKRNSLQCDSAYRRRLDTIIENVKYWKGYIETTGTKLYRGKINMVFAVQPEPVNDIKKYAPKLGDPIEWTQEQFRRFTDQPDNCFHYL